MNNKLKINYINAGKDTRFGSQLYENADFLAAHQPSSTNRTFWAVVDGYWTGYSQEDSWDQSNRPQGTSEKKYFDTLDHNLNQAVYYCATALNFIINHAGYIGCDCGSGSGNNPNPPPPDGDKSGVGLGEELKVSIDTFNGLLIFSSIGLIATALALTLLNAASLEKYLLK